MTKEYINREGDVVSDKTFLDNEICIKIPITRIFNFIKNILKDSIDIFFAVIIILGISTLLLIVLAQSVQIGESAADIKELKAKVDLAFTVAKEK